MTYLSNGLAILAVALFGGGFLAFFAGELLIGGVCFLGASFTIYLRETRS